MHRVEVVVDKWLQSLRLVAERYSDNELNPGQKSPDFKVTRDGVLRFFCEVKCVDENAGGASTLDPLPNKLSKDIYEAYKQFQSVNPMREFPNVLAFVNYDIGAWVDYLEDVLLGST